VKKLSLRSDTSYTFQGGRARLILAKPVDSESDFMMSAMGRKRAKATRPSTLDRAPSSTARVVRSSSKDRISVFAEIQLRCDDAEGRGGVGAVDTTPPLLPATLYNPPVLS
jgi:hypothetical protein